MPQSNEHQNTSKGGEKAKLSTNQLIAEKGVKNQQSGYNCAQSVLLTLYENIDPEAKNELVPKVASAFGGGIGRCGSICGALTGSLMAVGIKYGSNESGAEKQAKAYANAKIRYEQFQKQNGSVLYRDLINYDLSNPEQAAKARQEKVFEKVFANLIRTSIINFLELEK